ncbi:MFS transporter [Gammaproteobacteria bacterium]|nr:MFS transporter [Gammaproteobacteria bacterium]
MISKEKTPLNTILWIMVFDHASLNMTFPILTMVFFDPLSHIFTKLNSFEERSLWYGVCIAIPHIMNIFFTPLLSSLSDDLGRKRILSLGVLGAIIFSLIAALGVYKGSLVLLFIALIVRGIFSRTNPIGQAIIGDISDKSSKVLNMGYLQGAISIGAFLGPVIGGYFANRYFFSTLNFSLPFLLASFIASISLFITILYFKETITHKKKGGFFYHLNYKHLQKIIKYPDISTILIILLLTQVSWSIYYQYIPPILKTVFKLSANQLGIFIGLTAVWLTFTTMFGIKILQKYFNLKAMLKQSIILILIGLIITLLSLFTKLKFLIWIAAIPIAFGDVVAYSCLVALFSNLVNKNEQGKSMGICFLIVATTWGLTGVVGGFIMSINIMLPIILAIIPLLIVFILIKKRHLTPYLFL